jgi:hypothetical protein
MSKKLLFQFDTDSSPSVFDTVVAYDGGADRVTGISNVNIDNVSAMVDGCIYTRALKKNTAIFVGGSSLEKGEKVFSKVNERFFGGFKVSTMFDSNGSNTTAAAAVAHITNVCSPKNKKAVVLGGTGPVGQRAAALLAKEGADVFITSRSIEKANVICQGINNRFSIKCKALPGETHKDRCTSISDAAIVVSTGASGVVLLEEIDWSSNPLIEVLCDANAMPPLGISGIEMNDKAKVRHGKKTFGAIGFGGLKISVHRSCISKLFETNDLCLDAEEIYLIAKSML